LKSLIRAWLNQFFTLKPNPIIHPQIRASFRRNFLANAADVSTWMFGDSFVSVYTILPVFASTLTSSPIVIGLIPAIKDAGWFLPQLFLVPKVERSPRQLPAVMLLGAIERLPYLALAFAALWLPSLPQNTAVLIFLLLMIWLSVTSGLVALPWQELIARLIPVSHRGRFWGFATVIGSLMGVIGAAIAGIILARVVYSLNYALCFLIGFLSFALGFVFLTLNREPDLSSTILPPSRKKSSWGRIKTVMRENKNFRNFITSQGMAYLGSMAFGFVAVYSIQRFNLPDASAAIFTAILIGGGAVGFALWGFAGDHLGYKRVLIYSGLCWVLGLTLLITAPSVVWVFPAFAFMSIANSGHFIGDINIVMEFSSISDRPTYIGLARTLTGPVLLIAPILAGAIVQIRNYQTMFTVSIFFSVIGLILLVKLVVEPRQHADTSLGNGK
jgi:MFS family permease